MKSKYNNKEFLTKKYEELKNGDLIAQEIGVTRTTVYRWLREYGITSKPYKRHSVNEKYFSNIDTEEKAYYLGFIYADGCVYRGDSKNSIVFQINLSVKDRKILEDMNKAFNSDYPIVEFDGNYGNRLCKLKISNTEFCRNLMSQGVTFRKTYECHYPKNISNDLERHFIRGLFDGDGCIYHNKKRKWNRMSFHIFVEKEFSEEIRDRLKEAFGVESYIYNDTRSDVIRNLAIFSTERLEKMYHILYDDASYYFERKKRIFDYFMQELLASRQMETSGQ